MYKVEIQERNAAQDQRIDSIANSILHYKTLIGKVRERYKISQLEDQYRIKPYLTTLYFELGQLLEEQEQTHQALHYYEQAGRYGHLISIENAKRLGSKTHSVLTKEIGSNKLEKQRDFNIDIIAEFEILHKSIVLIEGVKLKGSAVVAYYDKLETAVLITVEHVAKSGEIAYLGKQKVQLSSLKSHNIGPNTLFVLDDSNKADFQNSLKILINEQLKVGEKVYFGGYPFTKAVAHLHVGRVSSIGRNGEFSIDGTAVSGMSGGPIAIEREGIFYVVGTIASETFDPIEGFSRALDDMYSVKSVQDIADEFLKYQQALVSEEIQSNPHFTKIHRNNFFIADLESQKTNDPYLFTNIWDDLNKKGIIANSGEIASEKIICGQLGLRKELQQYENEVIGCLRARTKSIDPSDINLPYDLKNPNDSINTVSLSLAQSLSTGLITGNLFQGSYEMIYSSKESKSELVNCDTISYEKESTEFTIGKKKQFKKDQKASMKLGNKTRLQRMEAINAGNFKNHGAPTILYRFVSDEDEKNIKKNGIVHSGTPLDEIPFLTKPKSSMAKSVGAVSLNKMITIITDKIPGLSPDNVRQVKERNGVITYRINTSIPKEAIC